MYWIMVMGLNQKRWRGRMGLSEGIMKMNVCKTAVAAAFDPPPPLMVMVGADVYPEPALVRVTAVTFLPETVAVATAPDPLVPALLKVMVGTEV
jgi:hypothetical protein